MLTVNANCPVAYTYEKPDKLTPFLIPKPDPMDK